MVALYAVSITFTLLLIGAIGHLFYMIRKKKANTTFYCLMLPLLVFLLIIAFIFDYDVVKHQQGEVGHVTGSCETTFIRGGKSLDTTEVVIDNEKYSIKSDAYKHLQEGLYECDLTYAPITKFVLEATIE